MSAVQQRFWLLEQLQLFASAHHAVRLEGALDTEALESSLCTVVARHEVLRSTFPIEDGRPVAEVLAMEDWRVRVVDLSEHSLLDRENEGQRVLRRNMEQSFDLAHGPLFRALLVRLSARVHLLLLSVHRLVADRFSMNVVLRELSELYRDAVQGRESTLAQPQGQYWSLAVEMDRQLRGEAGEQLLRFWRDYLPDPPHPLHLRYERSPTEATWDASRLARVLEKDITYRLERLAEAEGCTVETVVLAAFDVLLHRLTGFDHLAVGMPVAHRDPVTARDVVGPLGNILVVCLKLAPGLSFRGCLRQLMSSAEAAYTNRRLPFERLVRELQPDVEPAIHPLANVAFDPAETPLSGVLKLQGLEVSQLALGVERTPFSLKLAPRRQGDGLLLDLVYQKARFEQAWMEIFLNQLAHVLGQIAVEPDRRVRDFSLVSPECAAVLPDPLRALRAASLPPVTSCLAEIARRHPEWPALASGERSWSYGELSAAVDALARTLVAEGCAPGDPVAVCGTMCFGAAVAMAGAMRAGGVVMTIDPLHPVQRQKAILERGRARWLLYCGGAAELADTDHQAAVLRVDDDSGEVSASEARAPVHELAELPELSPHDPAYMAFTSGTTGIPKGILGRHKGLSHAVLWQAEEFSIGAGDRVAQLAAMSFDTMFRELFLSLTSGACLELRPAAWDYSADSVVPWCAERGISVINTVPAMLQSWLGTGAEMPPMPHLRWVFVVGETLTGTLAERWQKAASGSLVNLYGTTETNLLKLFYRVPEPPFPGSQPAGLPLPESQALVLAHERLCGRGEPGEVFVRTPYLSGGYVGDREATDRVFVPNPLNPVPEDLVYKTGDRGWYLPDGGLQLAGRFDRQVKIRGVRIEPDEVAAVLAGHPAVAACAVGARVVGRNQLALVAYVVPRHAEGLREEELQSWTAARLPAAMVPARVVELAELPASTAGRVDHKALAALPLNGGVATRRESGPAVLLGSRLEVEELLRGLWSELVGGAEPGAHESFFAAGGDSLLATQLISRVSSVLGVEVPLRSFFEGPSISRLADAVLTRLKSRDGSPAASPIHRISRKKIPALSFAQQRVWFMHQLMPRSPAYNLPTAFHIRGELYVSTLIAALNEVVCRHESLRTSFPTLEDEPRQVVAEDLRLGIPVVDLRALGSREAEGEARRLVEEEATRVFDLEHGPLVRALLFRCADEEWIFFVNLHHIISDGWSQGILFRELSAIYTALHRGASPTLPRLEIQYRDFAVWQRAWLSGEVLESQLEYWLHHLRDLVPLRLPADKRPSNGLVGRGDVYETRIDASLSREVEALSLRSHSSLFMTLLAAFMVVLQRWCGQDEVVVGTPIANRNREEIEGLIGFFVNNLVMRGDLSGDPSFAELLHRVRGLALEAYAHQDLPFDRLVEKMAVQRELGRHPLFQVLFALHNVPRFDLELDGVEVAPYNLEFEPVGLDLELHLWRTDNGLRLRVGFDGDRFSTATVAQLARHLERVLMRVTEDPELRLSELSLISEREREKLLGGFWTRAPYADQSAVHQLVEARVEACPEALAVEAGPQCLSYAELNARSNQLARRLQSLGLEPRQRVAICMERSVSMVVSVLAVLKAGCAFVPLDPEYPLERLQFMIEDSGASLVLIADGSCDLNATAELPRLNVLDEDWLELQDDDLEPSVGPDDLAYVIYTSGSTGLPKGVALPHRGLCNLVRSHQDELGFGPQDRILQFASFSFDGSVWEIFGALCSGACLVLGRRHDLLPGEELVEFMRRAGITVAVMPPSALAALPPAELPSLRVLGAVGEACSRQLIERWSPGRLFFNGYGPTEVTVCATLAIFGDDSTEPLIGKPINNVETYVVDRRLELVAIGTAGELCIGGPGVAQGYLNRPELTAERFIANPFLPGRGRLYRSGDLVRQRADGSLEFLGRIDRQVKLRGFRVELDEVAAVLGAHKAVLNAVVEPWGSGPEQRLLGYVVLAPEAAGDGAPPGEDELRSHLVQRVPDYMVPARIMVLEELPLTANGKLDRSVLPVPAQLVRSSVYMAASTSTEERLQEIWRLVLGLDRVGVGDDFFELGGESLLAVRMVEQARRNGIPLSARMVFEHPTISALAEVVEGLENDGERPPLDLETADRSGRPPSAATLRGASSGAAAEGFRHLLVLRKDGDEAPLYLVHPFGGFVLSYRPLVNRLQSTCPVFGFEAWARDHTDEVLDDLNAMASVYLEELRRQQPAGPYLLGGWSMGGVVAFEMARRLREDYGESSRLVLIDASPPEGRVPRSVQERLQGLGRALDEGRSAADHWAGLGLEEAVRHVAQQLEAQGEDGADRLAEQLVYTRLGAHTRAILSYRARPFACAATLVRALERSAEERRDSTLGWGALAAERVDVVVIPGNHLSIMKSPHVEGLAAALDRFLNAETDR